MIHCGKPGYCALYGEAARYYLFGGEYAGELVYTLAHIDGKIITP